MFTNQESAIRLFEIQKNYTATTLAVFNDETLNKAPVNGFRTVAELAAHCIIVRESCIGAILADDSIIADLKVRFPHSEQIPAITLIGLLDIWRESWRIFRAGLDRIDWGKLDSPFKTHFGNYSTTRNYLSLILQEEIHHRGQMILICRLFGLTPPKAPYNEIAELGVEQ